jgi:hypothetical protein
MNLFQQLDKAFAVHDPRQRGVSNRALIAALYYEFEPYPPGPEIKVEVTFLDCDPASQGPWHFTQVGPKRPAFREAWQWLVDLPGERTVNQMPDGSFV